MTTVFEEMITVEKILISRCLLGENCTYRGDNNFCEKAARFREKYEVIPVCPEMDGGLPVPRDPAERIGDKVISKSGKDVTAEYLKGAETALKLACKNDVKLAILKARSPSCQSFPRKPKARVERRAVRCANHFQKRIVVR